MFLTYTEEVRCSNKTPVTFILHHTHNRNVDPNVLKQSIFNFCKLILDYTKVFGRVSTCVAQF